MMSSLGGDSAVNQEMVTLLVTVPVHPNWPTLDPEYKERLRSSVQDALSWLEAKVAHAETDPFGPWGLEAEDRTNALRILGRANADS